MKQSLTLISMAWVAAIAVAAAPAVASAQDTNKVPVDKKAPARGTNSAPVEKSAKAGPFKGKLAAIDKVSKTISVGKRTFQITSETKIKKAGKPATLEDGVVGETVSGYVKPGADGKLNATTVNFGPKASADSGEKTKTPASEKQKEAK